MKIIIFLSFCLSVLIVHCVQMPDEPNLDKINYQNDSQTIQPNENTQVQIKIVNKLLTPVSIYINSEKYEEISASLSSNFNMLKPKTLKISFTSHVPSYNGVFFGYELADELVNTANVKNEYNLTIDNEINATKYGYIRINNESQYILTTIINEGLQNAVTVYSIPAWKIIDLGYYPIYTNSIINSYWVDISNNFHWNRYCNVYSSTIQGSGLLSVSINSYYNNYCY